MDKKTRRIGMVVGFAIATVSLIRLAFLLPGILPKNYEKELRKCVAQLKSTPMEQQGDLMESIFKCCAELGPKSKFAEPDVRQAAKACYDATAGAGKPLGDHGFSILLHSAFAFERMGELEPETEELLKNISEDTAARENPVYGQIAIQALKAYTGSIFKRSNRIVEEANERVRNAFANLGNDGRESTSTADEPAYELTAKERSEIASTTFTKYEEECRSWKDWRESQPILKSAAWCFGIDLSDPAVDWTYLKESGAKETEFVDDFLASIIAYDARTSDISPDIRRKARDLFRTLLRKDLAPGVEFSLEDLFEHGEMDPECLLEYGRIIQSKIPKRDKLYFAGKRTYFIKHIVRLKDSAKKKRCVALMRDVCDEEVLNMYQAYVNE